MQRPSYAAGTLGMLLAFIGSAALAQTASQARGNDPWQNVVPEQGIVMSGNGTPYGAPYFVQAAPVYAAPVYAAPMYAPPVYVQPAWGWPAPYVYPPIGVSIGLGYSRGWYGGGWHGYRGWR